MSESHRNVCGPGAKFLALGALAQAGASIGFPLALIETTAAKALLLFSVNPLWASLIGRVVLNDPLNKATIAAVILALIAVLIVFVPDMVPSTSSSSNRSNSSLTLPSSAAAVDDNGTLHGDMIAVLTGVMVAAYININRFVRQRRPSAQPAMAFVGFSGAVTAALITLPRWQSGNRHLPQQQQQQHPPLVSKEAGRQG